MRALTYSVVAMLVAFVGARTASAGPSTFELTVSPASGTMDDTYFATVTISVAGVGGPKRYWPPGMRGFTLVDQKTDRSSVMQVDPQLGRTMVTTDVHRYVLKAKYPGNFEISPARVRLDDGDFTSKSAFISVRPGVGVTSPESADVAPSSVPDPTSPGGVGAPGFVPPDPYGAEDVFIHVVADKRRPYMGEQVTVTWLLYSRQEVLKFEAKSQRLDNIWTETLFEPTGFFKYYESMVGRRRYSVAIVAKKAVFPTRSGQVRIAPFVADVVVLGAPLGAPTRVRSSSLSLEVRRLPGNAPKEFDPTYVGDITVEANIERTELDEGEATFLELLISGTGAFRRHRTPELKFEGFDVTPPTEYDEKIDTSQGRVTGSRRYRYWVKPLAKGAQTIPVIDVPYFDPDTGKYNVAKTRPLPLLVADSNTNRAERVVVRDNLIDRDIRLIHSSAVASRVLPTFYRSLWFWLLLLFPPFVYAGVVGVDRIRRHLRRETPRARSRRARGRARKHLRVAEIHLRGDRAGKFYGQLARALQEFLDERLEQAAHSMTREELEQALRKHGFPTSIVTQITKALDECDYARFSPDRVSKKEMRNALERVQQLLKAIESPAYVELSQ